MIQFGHKRTTKPQLLSHKYREIHYGAEVQVVPEEITSPGLDATGIKCVQEIVVSVLFYGQEVDKNE